MAGEMLELREALQGGGFGRGGDRGGRGGDRGGRGGFGGRGGGRGRGSFEQEDPATVSLEAVGVFKHPCEEELVVKSTNEKIPYFNANIYLENRTVVGKV